MELILHRRNTLIDLQSANNHYGIEIDLRSNNGKIIINHDAMKEGDNLEDWLKEFNHGTLILNVKEDGLEEDIIVLMEKNNIENFFFLDLSFPTLVRLAQDGEKRCAVRVSEFESVQDALLFKNKVNWIWVDCFDNFSLNYSQAELLVSQGFKLCFVSPELQGKDPNSSIPEMQLKLRELGNFVNAVCTKNPQLWES